MTDTTQPTGAAMPILPQSLLNLIAEYGLSRTDGASDVERMDCWTMLIEGIREYARSAAKTASDMGIPVSGPVQVGGPDFNDPPDAYLYKTAGPWDIEISRQECQYGGIPAARIVPVWFVSREWKKLQAGGLTDERSILADALSSFATTQSIDIYPPNHWSQRARAILAQAGAPATAKESLLVGAPMQQDIAQFEALAKYQGLQDFTRAADKAKDGEIPSTHGGKFSPATYYNFITELAYRVWANKRATSVQPVLPFQDRVQPWMMACFGSIISGDREERNHRFLEESLELVQACGATQSEAHQLVDYVYGRPVGEKSQEVGGVMVTLAALCLAQGLDMSAAAETELARIWTKVEQIRAKQAAKPKYSPLPEAAPTQPKCGMCNGHGIVGHMTIEGGEGYPCPGCDGSAQPAQSAIDLAVLAEREACRLVCMEGMDPNPMDEWARAHNHACKTRAYAISERSRLRVAPQNIPSDSPTEIEQRARSLVADAAAAGVVLTIEQVSRMPLAMGNYDSVVSVRPARGKP